MKKIISVMLLIVSLQGCYYTRLLEVKKQMKDFERYFHISNENNFTMEFKKPILLEKDIVKILNSAPYHLEEINDKNNYHYILIKDISTKKVIDHDYDIPICFKFENGKLKKYISDKKFPKVFSKLFLNDVFKGVGHAKLDKKRFLLLVDLKKNMKSSKRYKMPTVKNFLEFLGEPSEIVYNESRYNLSYRYQLRGSDKNNLKLDFKFYFNINTMQLNKLSMQIKGYDLY